MWIVLSIFTWRCTITALSLMIFTRHEPKNRTKVKDEHVLTFLEDLPAESSRKQILFYLSERNTDNKLISQKLRSVQNTKGYDVIIICHWCKWLINLQIMKWLPRNRLVYYQSLGRYGKHEPNLHKVSA